MLTKSRTFGSSVANFFDHHWPTMALVVWLPLLGVLLYDTIADGSAAPILIVSLIILAVLLGDYDLRCPIRKRVPELQQTGKSMWDESSLSVTFDQDVALSPDREREEVLA